MARKNNPKVRRGTPEEHRAAAAEYEAAVGRLQRSAYWNLRTRIANVSIVLGLLSLVVVASGGADGARLAPTLVCAIAGVCGAGVYFSRPYPALTRRLLIASVTLTVLGVIALVIVVGAGK
ncbi:hypothetical protein OHA21_35480 [Actinoplanes sp. NBC_00393]|uniref:hypothetical protein n=1 Tax=Actinoplanes sp. NBC_00393 TaxID=2975953 RepID=UPI002E1A1A34